jgi:hypothetical protein
MGGALGERIRGGNLGEAVMGSIAAWAIEEAPGSDTPFMKHHVSLVYEISALL